MSSSRQRNDPKGYKSHFKPQKSLKAPAKPAEAPGKRSVAPAEKGSFSQKNHKPKVNEDGLIWGVHTVIAALKNLSRPGPLTLYVSPDRHASLPPALLKRESLRVQVMESADIGRIVPPNAVHQGVALRGPVPEGDDLETLIENGGVIVMLDQVTDPQNVGAIFRSAAAFGASGLIFQARHSPAMQGVLAKTAAGAMDSVPFCHVTNLSRALETLGKAGFISVGLAGETDHSLKGVLETAGWHEKRRSLVIVMGSEGDGLRRLVGEHCDYLARIPMPGDFESLNVAHATSIVLYEVLGRDA